MVPSVRPRDCGHSLVQFLKLEWLVVGATRIAKGVETLHKTNSDRAPEKREGQQIKIASDVHIETKDRQ